MKSENRCIKYAKFTNLFKLSSLQTAIKSNGKTK